MEEDDDYGDLYDNAYNDDQQYGDEQEQEQEQEQDDYQQPEPAVPYGGDQAAKDSESRVKELQKKLMESLVAADRWRTAFKEIAALCGFPAGPGREPDIPSVVEAVQRIKTAEQSLQEEVKLLRKREAGLQIQLAERNLEAVELRRGLQSAWAAADPNVIQLKQLLLDPALNREFTRLRSELESTQKELKHVQEELAATNFTQESKVGRQLMAKCRALADENEEMARELAEGKMHELESQLAMAKDSAAEMVANCLELEDHSAMLDEEAEELQRDVFSLRRELLELKGEPMGGQPGMPPDFIRRGEGPPPGMGFRGRGGRGMLGFKRGMDGPHPPHPGRFMVGKRMR
mmetsp:Transcript_23737/g.52082  ORF Transcript_23737/g.52082 Transcript_23737/m.52082 type:complete len:347 (+) Transcript_23737:93-1133(+)|eukprot:CAMPEP_0202892168 /NCGR_PEP_ID=MMETSP1392-20130828/1965_1 /ASSEMBLY_ACC=CAM_ASM_000868 /TAXON_ID=225041 /ORGANISM="Chlamydomonas chlamydogama, Strain SAG 11-48b" /LENGTH=346 /DNA_ID=CAMNT_0049576053 /DNA_START=90 /DNA_END=1130 /DNA_ORIENTATION=+